MGTDLDLDLLRVFGLGHLDRRLATPRTGLLVGRQFNHLFHDGQMRVIASPRAGRARLMTARPPCPVGGFRIAQAVGAVLGRFLLRLGREEPVFELSILSAKRVDFLLEFLVLPLRLLEHPLPIPDLLPQLGNLAA